MNKLSKLAALLLVSSLAACSSTQTVNTDAPQIQDPDVAATVSIEQTQVMLFVGGSKGDGVVNFKGKEYPFEISAVKLGGVGIHNLELTGDVYYMDDIKQLEGTYFSAEAAITVVKGTGGFWMKNGNGVKIKLTSKDQDGLALGLGLEGVKITLTDS